MIAEFEAHLRSTRGSLHTVNRYVRDAEEFLAFLGDRPVSVAAVEGWAAALNHGRLRPQTIRRRLAGVRALLGWMGAHGDTAARETLVVLRDYRVAPPTRQADVRQIQPATEEDYQRARQSASPEGRALADLLWWTGCRISEVVGDAVAGIPALTATDGQALVQEGHVSTIGKGKKRRILVLPTRGRELLQPYVETRAAGAGALFPMSYVGAWRLLKSIGVPPPHAWRHAYRARLRKAGVHDQVAKALLGHGPHDVTESYGRVGLDEMLDAAERTAADGD